MRALVYHGPGHKAWEEVPEPTLVDDTDAIVRVDAVTICGTDLHILEGDIPTVTPGRILGHEAVGTIQSVGAGVKTRKPGVLVSCITACGACRYCREGSYGQCLGGGGWILGHKIDGTQAEFVRVPFADTSTPRAGGRDGRAVPAPIGLSVMMGARLYNPSHVVAIDLVDSRLDAAKQFGADAGDPAATSPTSACTEDRRPCTSRSCGSRT